MLETGSVQCCITSPPYWGLRDYGVDGQIGNEATIKDHLAVMVAVFHEVHRVLRPDGTLWLNYGDCYVGSNHKHKGKESARYAARGTSDINQGAKARYGGLSNKNLIGMPWHVAFALQADGWILRRDIVFEKPNAMPDSAPDRPGCCHEFVFLFAKQQRYYYNRDAVKVPTTGKAYSRGKGGANSPKCQQRHYTAPGQSTQTGLAQARHKNNASFAAATAGNHKATTRHLRDVWSINTFAYPDAHFATFPPDLARIPILAGCPTGGIVLDPFLGSGTTACVALEHGRRCIGIELNWNYVKLAVKRIFDSEQKRMEGIKK